MSNSNLGINLVTLATSTTIANISTNAGATYLDGTTNLKFIAPNCGYSQISTLASNNNAYTLPFNPIVGQTYTIRNDGSYILSIFPGTSSSQILVSGSLLPAGSCGYVGSGDSITLLCVSNNGALNTQSGANPFNNPASVFDVITETLKTSPIIFVPASGGAIVLGSYESSTTVIIPTLTANGTCNLTTLLSPGIRFKFICSGTLGNTFTITATNLINGVIANTGNANVLTAIAKAQNITVQFTATAHTGDWVELICDGTNWYVSGLSTVIAGLA